MSEVEETYLEGMWDCPNCETANKGSEMKCGGCGSTRDEDVKFYLPENAKEITDQAELDAAKAGADWICGFCSTTNPATITDCKQCGGPRDEGTEQKAEEYKPAGAASDAPPAPAPSPAPSGEEGGGGMPMGIIAGIVVLILLSCCCMWWMFFKKTTETMTVSNLQWEREIPREELYWSYEESERRPISSSKIRRVRSKRITVTKSVPVKKQVTTTKMVDLKNGKFKKVKEKKWVTENVTKKVSVDGYAYEQLKTKTLKSLTKRGPPDVAPVNPNKTREIGKQIRYLPVQTHYIVTFSSKEGETHELSSKDNKELAPKSIEELKSKYPKGSSWKVTYSGTGISNVEKP